MQINIVKGPYLLSVMRKKFFQKFPFKNSFVNTYKRENIILSHLWISIFKEFDFKIQQENTHWGETFHCQICGSEFSMSSTLENHMWIHKGEKLFSCQVCRSICLVSIILKSTFKYTLVICIFTEFKFKAQVWNHFLVKFCRSAFSPKSHLTSHIQCHTG